MLTNSFAESGNGMGNNDRDGIIETIDANGEGTLRDMETGQLEYFSRDGEFHRGAGALVVGTPVTYMKITTPKGKIIIRDIRHK
ncbi:MAG: hypothetical protein K0S44_3185 [Bacteroidetes bacterium]|jgi:hypothetical protein|nr:hypothetical protein [Bacteroidota bacterium]